MEIKKIEVFLVVLLAGFGTSLYADTYSLVMQPPNGYRIPRVIGVSGGYVDGYVDDVYIYDYPLTTQQMEKNIEKGASESIV